jgi:hypothetical protein
MHLAKSIGMGKSCGPAATARLRSGRMHLYSRLARLRATLAISAYRRPAVCRRGMVGRPATTAVHGRETCHNIWSASTFARRDGSSDFRSKLATFFLFGSTVNDNVEAALYRIGIVSFDPGIVFPFLSRSASRSVVIRMVLWPGIAPRRPSVKFSTYFPSESVLAPAGRPFSE